MSAYDRMALTVVRLVAGAFLLVGGLNLALYWFKTHHDRTDMHSGRLLYLSIPLVIGVAILVKSSTLARIVDEYLDD
jgi:uncharacterized membrane protein HdeD (DUF308 family)